MRVGYVPVVITTSIHNCPIVEETVVIRFLY